MERNNIKEIVNKRFDLTKAAVKHFGADSQLNIAIEELAELQQAICKVRRGAGIENLIEEIADVEIMLTTLNYIFKINPDDILKVQGEKLNRLERWIKNNVSNADTLKDR